MDTTAIFYADDGNLMGTNPITVQYAFDLLCTLFGRLGFSVNARKTKTMVCAPPAYCTGISTPAYKRRITNQGDSYGTRKRRRIQCPHCDAEVQERHLTTHINTQHGITYTTPPSSRLSTSEAPRTYNMDMDNKDHTVCPVPLCEFATTTRYQMRVHFAFLHPRDQLNIAQDAHLPYCTQCNMRVGSLGPRHTSSAKCRQLSELRIRRERLDATVQARSRRFTLQNDEELEAVDEFVYLGRPINTPDDDNSALKRNLQRARKRWGMIRRVLVREGANPRISGLFYKASCMTVLLYGTETWCWTQSMVSTLEGFHNRIARHITNRHIRPRTNDDGDEFWIYPSTTDTLDRAGLFPMKEYLRRRREPLQAYAETQSFYYHYAQLTETNTNPSRHFWWHQHDYFPTAEI